jgi:hypothetical protein
MPAPGVDLRSAVLAPQRLITDAELASDPADDTGVIPGIGDRLIHGRIARSFSSAGYRFDPGLAAPPRSGSS